MKDYTKATGDNTFANFMKLDPTERYDFIEERTASVIRENIDDPRNTDSFRSFLESETVRMTGMDGFGELVEGALQHSEQLLDGSAAETVSKEEVEFFNEAELEEVLDSVIATIIQSMKRTAAEELLLSVLGLDDYVKEKIFDVNAAIEELKKEAFNG